MCKECGRILDYNRMYKDFSDYVDKKKENKPIDEKIYKYKSIYDEENKVITTICPCGKGIIHNACFESWGYDPNSKIKGDEYFIKVKESFRKLQEEYSKKNNWK